MHMTLTKFHSNEPVVTFNGQQNQISNEDEKTPKFIKAKPALTPRPINAGEK